MSSSVSLEHVTQFNMTEMITSMRDCIINGDPVGYMGASGAGKTTTLFSIANLITPDMLANHPLNSVPGRDPIDQVIPITINCAQYDAYTFRGIIVPGETVKHDATETSPARTETKSSLTTPLWYSDLTRALTMRPNAQIVLGFDEINVADAEFQSSILQLLSEGRVGPHVIPRADRDRVGYMFLGNRPEDLPSSFTLIGPLAQRAWWYQVNPTAKEVLDHLDSAGASSPEVHWFLNEYPGAVFVHGLTDDGTCLELNQMGTDDDDGNDRTVVPCANGVNPRRWMQVSRRLQRMRADGMSQPMRMKILGGAVPKPVAMQLAVAMEMADLFATVDQVQSDPTGAVVPEGALLQSMQIRSLMPKISADNVDAFVQYAKRFKKSSCSGIVAYLMNKGSGGSKRMLSSGRDAGISPEVRQRLSAAFIQDYTASLGNSMGINVQHTVTAMPSVSQPTAAVAAPVTPPVPVIPAIPAAPVQPAQPAFPATQVPVGAVPPPHLGMAPSAAQAAAQVPSAAAPVPAAAQPEDDDDFEW